MNMFACTCIFVAVLFIVTRIWFYFTKVRCKSKVCLLGKTALVTGGSAGIGFEIVLGLASRGCRVIIADKNVNEHIKDAIIKETHNPNIVMKYVDLASFKSVRQLAEDLNSSEKVIDILINNAGIGNNSGKSEDNLNMVMQINYYSGFLLTHLLLGLLKHSKTGRIIFTSSGLCFLHKISRKRILQNKIDEECKSICHYSDSKFLQIVASDMFAKKLRQFNISSNTFHPHIVKTTIYESLSNQDLIHSFVYFFFKLFLFLLGQTAEDGAQTGIYLACANEVKQTTGKFFGATYTNPKPRGCFDRNLREAIWKCSENAVKLKPEEKL